MKTVKVYIGLGSNLEQPIKQVKKALEAINQISQTKLLKKSSLYRSDSLLDGQPRYINAVACIETVLSAIELLDHLQTIELTQGRVRHEHWGARTLDLDILLYGNEIINTPRLVVPHAEMAKRIFVLMPLIEISPQLTLPNGQAVANLLYQCEKYGIEKLDDLSIKE